MVDLPESKLQGADRGIERYERGLGCARGVTEQRRKRHIHGRVDARNRDRKDAVDESRQSRVTSQVDKLLTRKRP